MATDGGYTFYHIDASGKLTNSDNVTVIIETSSGDKTVGGQVVIGSAPGPIMPLDTTPGYGYSGDVNPTDTLTINFSNGSVWTDAGYNGSGTAPNGSTGLMVSFFGNYFISKDAGLDGQTVTLHPGAETAICFYPGTRIATPAGEQAVEMLQPGDDVLTDDGQVRTVRWIGRQTISTLFADALRVLPIRVRAGALADNVPARDLLVSPDHALLVDGVLIHAGALVNGTSIVRELNVPTTFVYYHVEVDDHALILAENTPAETFVDIVQRMNFDNWAEHEALYPQGKPIDELSYPRAKSHRQVPVVIRSTLAGRAAAIGTTTALVA